MKDRSHSPSLAIFFAITLILTLSLKNAAKVQAELQLVGTVQSKSYYWEPSQNLTWIESYQLCHLNGMTMATVMTTAQQFFLEEAGRRLGWSTYLNLAASDMFNSVEGEWLWIRSGQHLNAGFTNWVPGSPWPEVNGGRNWNCLAMDPAENWGWVDMACSLYPCITLCEA